MRKGKEKTARNCRYPGMRRQIFFLLALFTALVLLLLWFFQIVLLRPMYETIRSLELRRTSGIMAACADTEDWQEEADRLAQKTTICISVYEIHGSVAKICVFSHINNSCTIHNVNENPLMNRLYEGAGKEGYYTELIADKSLTDKSDIPRSLIAARSVHTEQGNEYLIVLNAEIEPVGTTAETLTVQLGIITVILILAAALLAVVASGRISRPLSQMSYEAGKLAQGNYNVHFDGGTTRESAELGRALNYAAHELSALDAMQKELIANISHDLRTPLTMISGYSEIMRDIPTEMTAENMQIIIDETQRLTALVNDILDLSKLTNGTGKLECEIFSLTDTVRSTLDRYSKLRNYEGYSISFEYDRPACIYADRTKILQVVYNLVNNAINYTGADKTVVIRQICENGMCKIEVTDTGEGIPKEQLALIWDRYYKVKNYYKRAVTGTGLGLSIVKNILHLHGAEFGVRSEVGHGSTFWFALPEVSENAESEEIRL